MEAKQQEMLVSELELRVERLRQLYDQYFLGFEKLEPTIARKDVDRKFELLRKEHIRNTGVRFRFQVLTQRYNTFQSYWHRICRQIELGTYERHVNKARKKYGDGPNSVRPAPMPDIPEVSLAPEIAAPLVAAAPAAREASMFDPASLLGDDAPITEHSPEAVSAASPAAPQSVRAPLSGAGPVSNNPKRVVIRKAGVAAPRSEQNPNAAPPSAPASSSSAPSIPMRAPQPTLTESGVPQIRPRLGTLPDFNASAPASVRPPPPPASVRPPPPAAPPLMRAPQASYVDIKLPPTPPTSRNPGVAQSANLSAPSAAQAAAAVRPTRTQPSASTQNGPGSAPSSSPAMSSPAPSSPAMSAPASSQAGISSRAPPGTGINRPLPKAPAAPPVVRPRTALGGPPPPPMVGSPRAGAPVPQVPAASEARMRAPVVRPIPAAPSSSKDSESRLRDPAVAKGEESTRAAGPRSG